MKKYFIPVLVLIFVALNYSYLGASDFAPDKVIESIDNHSVAIAVYYIMGEEEFNRRYDRHDTPTSELCQVIFIDTPNQQGLKQVAYIGAGTVLKDNHIITVAHLINHDENTLGTHIYIFKKGYEWYYEADVIAKCYMQESTYDDYAVLKVRKDMHLPGVKISPTPPQIGDKVIYVGSPRGLAFCRRFGYLSSQKYRLYKADDGNLHIGYWERFEYYMVTGGSPGDSGGGIFNKKGELIGIMYYGVNIGHTPVFSNPLKYLWRFLDVVQLRHLGR